MLLVSCLSYSTQFMLQYQKCPDHNGIQFNECIVYQSLNGFPYMRYVQRFGYNTQSRIKIMSIYAYMSVLHVLTNIICIVESCTNNCNKIIYNLQNVSIPSIHLLYPYLYVESFGRLHHELQHSFSFFSYFPFFIPCQISQGN